VNLKPEDLQKLARLARLSIREDELESTLPALESVVNWVGELASAPTDGVMPMAHPDDLALRLRPDEAQPMPPRESLMHNAPQASAGLFIVPRVVE
jgi:aspartyl-tRNA(Asn)/glutamyl-tRNA(Gln) amidotransferase subunit C